MSVFTKEAFTMSALPTPEGSAAPSRAASRRPSFAGSMASRRSSFAVPPSGTITPAEDPHIVEIAVESVLFDMDGTLIKSSEAVVVAWKLFAETYPLDLDDILRSAHGMRTIDVLKKWCKVTDPVLLEKEVIRFETAILNAAEAMAAKDGAKGGIEVLPGVARLLDELSADKDKRGGEEKWAICTSSTYFYAGKAIPIAKLTTPKIFVTADSVTRGKPFPDPYLLGAEGCNASPFESLVVEDAPTGIRAGKASGARVLATCTSHHREELEKEQPDYLVEDLSHVSAVWDEEMKVFRMIIEQPVDRRSTRPTPDATPVITPAVSRAGSFSGVPGGARNFFKPSDELTGNDSVIGSPAASRPGSPPNEKADAPAPGANIQRKPSGHTVTLEAFKRAFAGNAAKTAKKNSELSMDD